jgi:HPt (histidine-containing phosphotransfer) domain-containing protein
MTDPRGREPAERERHRQMLAEFLADATRDVERMRGMLTALDAGDAAAWARVQNLAHNLGARSQALKLGVMNACARELEHLTQDRENGAPLDDFFRQCVSSAIETLALEIETLRRP